jgi:broad specificity phosphatase PhoE
VSPQRLLLVRHGRTAWNAERRFQGQADPPLDGMGRAQAYELALLLAALEPDMLVSSDAVRATQTAEAVGEATGLEVLVDARLRERSLGHWEGLTRDEVAERYPDEYADWINGRDVTSRGGESRETVAARAIEAIDALPDVPLVVVITHSATAMAACNALLKLSQRVHVLGPLANCHWSELLRSEHEGNALPWRLRAHNIGAPGTVVPLPRLMARETEDAPDAEA